MLLANDVASDQPPRLQAQGGVDHLPFFLGGVCARSLAAAFLSSLDDFGLRSTLPADEAAAEPVPPLPHFRRPGYGHSRAVIPDYGVSRAAFRAFPKQYFHDPGAKPTICKRREIT
jgi:hypothetical protein